MKLLANTTAQAVLLIVILGFYGYSLDKDIGKLKRLREKQTSIVHHSSDVIYGEPTGIDIYGKRIVPSLVGTKRYVIFLLHSDNLQNDLTLWRHVEALLGSHREIELIGYCDGWQCAESMRRDKPLTIPVLAFGESTSVRAVVNADADGNAILKNAGTRVQSTILWRRSSRSPQDIVREAIR